MVARTGSYSPLSLATRLVQAVDAPDPTEAALFAVSETLNSGVAAFYAFNPADSTIVMTHATVGAALARDAIALHRLDDASAAARSLRDQEPVVLAEYVPPEGAAAALAELGLVPPFNLVSVPVTIGDFRFGVIQAVHVAPRYVGSNARAALNEIGVLFGATLASARRRTELTTLGNMIAQVNRSLHLRETLDAVLQGLMALMPCRSSAIYLDGHAPDALVQMALRTEGEGAHFPTTQSRPLDGSLTGWVYRHRQSVSVPDLLADPRVLRSGPDAVSAETPIRSSLMVPLMVGEGPVGTLIASRREVNAFSDDDLRIVERFAPLAAQAVVNARLYTEAENARQRSETLLEDMADAIIRLDRNSIVTGWNTGAERLFGYNAEEVIGTYPPLAPLDDYPETAGLWRRVLDNGESFTHIENRQRHKDGRWLDTIVSLSPWREQGAIVGAIAVVRDITSRKELERELAQRVADGARRERDAAFVAAVAQACNSVSSESATLQTLADLTAQWADSASVVTFDEESVHLAAYASRTPDEDAPIRRIIEGRAARQPENILEARVVAENTPRLLNLGRDALATPLAEAARARAYHTLASVPIRAVGQIVGVLSVAARAETPLLDAQAVATLELVAEQAGLAITKDRLLRQVRAQVRELEEANRHKDDFLASLSHELRTPLNAILGFGRLIADGLIDDPSELHEAAEDIVASGELLLAQVNDLLDMARVGAGRMAVMSEGVDIASVCRSCERVLSPLITAKRQELVIGVPPQTPLVRADAARLTQVVLNLLTNAHKFTPEGGLITVAVTASEETVTLTVQDTGIGIAPEHAALIFEPFRRVETGYARSQSGTGLGLALSRRLVELMGGTLTLGSAPGAGSVFTVTLPTLPVPSLV